MEDYLLREIDRIGEILLAVARKLGLFSDDVPKYSISDVQEEMDKVKLSLDIDTIFAKDTPILYLVENENISDIGLETFVEIIFHSDLDESKKATILKDAVNYLDNKGYYSFRLHSLADF